jgi:hypothetical protein
MEDLIMNAHILYDEQHSGHPSPPFPSPPLPPTPADERAPHFAYGSKNTKVVAMPPTPFAGAGSGLFVPSPPQDFAPKLPPRPVTSIHPSLRAGPASPTRVHLEVPPGLPLRHDKQISEPTPPSSPSATSTVDEIDDAPSQEPETSDQDMAPMPDMRPPSPLLPTTDGSDEPHKVNANE